MLSVLERAANREFAFHEDQAVAMVGDLEILGACVRLVQDAVVDLCRSCGVTWAAIADELKVTRQAAQQRFPRAERPPELF